jgi:hypothetical protein
MKKIRTLAEVDADLKALDVAAREIDSSIRRDAFRRKRMKLEDERIEAQLADARAPEGT